MLETGKFVGVWSAKRQTQSGHVAVTPHQKQP